MLQFENVYGQLPDSLVEEIKNLWRRETQVSDADERVKQVVYVIRDDTSGRVAGVSTVAKKRVPALNNHYLYEFRCYISQNHRVAGLDVKLSRATFDYIESINGKGVNKPVGIFSILENEELKKEPVWRRAVWPELDMHLVGFTKSGNPIRVHYFKGARI